ncbi:septum formation initiator family protein [Ornithinibacillus gellani]|uniref:FtsB family cell division protein n=1 Tax=Ornithinibacillus gellani TaxID=2293253 RepID=UPI000F47487F|nr:septum formation initiator family protein [Ornithinibacillus gellani]TQS75329.1 septum formation initiator family protein [Ornithinibacillus gellani]
MAEKEKSITQLNRNYIKQYDAYIERRKRKKKRLIRRLVLFTVIVMLAFGSLATYHIKQRVLHAEKKDQYEQLQKDYASLQKEENYLQEEIDLLNNDEYILEIARTNYFFSKKGELIFKIPNKDSSY